MRGMIAQVAALGLASSIGWAAPARLTDRQITHAVERTLLSDSALPGNQIDAVTHEGIVTLSGATDNLIVKERAVKLAQSLRGVRGVLDTITLDIPVVANAVLRKNVEAALAFDVATDAYEIQPDAADGVVTLRGTVQSYLERDLSIHVARGVKGVRNVLDRIIIRHAAVRPDAEIRAEVRRSIDIDVWLAPQAITVEVKGGAVSLSGEVGSAALHERARARGWTAGVSSVNAEALYVESRATKRGQRSDAMAVRSDASIRQAVVDGFFFDPRVRSFVPGVEVESGVVTLSGLVDNLKSRRAAEQDARNTVGVRQVVNLLKVRPVRQPADSLIAANIREAFFRDPFVDGYQIDARVKRGVVTMTGNVDSYFEKVRAEDLAARGRGVVRVTNNLAVTHPDLVHHDLYADADWSDTQSYHAFANSDHAVRAYGRHEGGDAMIKSNIERELMWSPYVDRDQIVVSVDHGVATLTGTARSWPAFRAATTDALNGGASRVINLVKVEL